MKTIKRILSRAKIGFLDYVLFPILMAAVYTVKACMWIVDAGSARGSK